MLALPTIDLHERLDLTQSSSTCSLEFRVSSVRRLLVHESLHFGDQTKSTCLSCCKYFHNLSVFVGHSGPSTCVACRRPTQVSSPCGLPIGVGRRSPLAQTLPQPSTSRRPGLPLAGLSRPATSGTLFVRRFSSNWARRWGRSTCLRHVSVRIAPAHIRPSCDHLTGSNRHSLVRCMGNHRVPTISIFFEPVCSSLLSGRARKILGSGRDDADDGER